MTRNGNRSRWSLNDNEPTPNREQRGLARTDTRQCRYRLAEPFAHERAEACCVSRLKGVSGFDPEKKQQGISRLPAASGSKPDKQQIAQHLYNY